ncbi:O-antigen ligase family protein [Aliarcobacter skirrowii]|uniref:O-antigen ligase family protein n=1 Tax=Aliarcobacter skirrowii TaxID=28200 RepID=UPI0021B2E572|nr:O-antigen ligase family protein [Aliarcobacter skirrowii]MCT7447123.1 O-antigen ligase family protein [Aliarcobacter skirrowii]
MILSIKQNYQNLKNNSTLIGNHLLVIYAYISPIYFRALASIIFILILLFLIRGNYKHYLSESISNNIVKAFLLYIAVHIIWTIGTDSFENIESLKKLKYFLYPLLILSFIDYKFIIRIIVAFVLGMLTSEIISYLIHFNIFPYKYELFNIMIYKAQDIDNPTPFLHHSFYNVFLSIVVGILLYGFLTRENNLFIKCITLISITTASINMVLIGGRAGYVSFVFVILITLYLIYGKKFFKIILPISLLSLMIFFSLAYNKSDKFKQRMHDTIRDKNEMSKENKNLNTSIGLRLGIWKYSYEVISENPIFGVGTKDDLKEVIKVIPDRYGYIRDIHHVHNEYIKNLLQFGIIGFVFFINIFYQIFKIKLDNLAYKNILIIFTSAFMILIIFDIMRTETWLVFIFMVSVLSSKANFLLEKQIKKLDYKSILKYIIAILVFIIYGLAQ